MSSGFEVRALTIDRNRLKRIRSNEEEEIFTIQVSNTMCYEHETKSGNNNNNDNNLSLIRRKYLYEDFQMSLTNYVEIIIK